MTKHFGPSLENDPDTPFDFGPRIEEAPEVTSLQPANRLFVGPPQRRPAKFAVSRLARWFGLDTWGTSLLSPSASAQLSNAADLLAVVFLFEWAMWALLFNTILHLRPLKVGWMTPAALALGLLFAWAVFVWEKSVITADLPSGSIRRRMPASLRPQAWRKLIAIGGRMVLILAAAVATAQPLELFVFNGAIENRIKEESVLAEALRQADDQAKDTEGGRDKTRADAQGAMQGTDESGALSQARSARDEARSRFDVAQLSERNAQGALQAARNTLRTWNDELASRRQALQRATDPVIQQSLALGVEQAQTQRDAAQRRLDQRQAAASAAQATLVDAQSERDRSEKGLGESQSIYDKVFEGERARLESTTSRSREAAVQRKAFIDALQAAPYGAPVTNPVTKTDFRWNESDFLDRLRILGDLTAGEPPRWPLTGADSRRSAVALFQLPDSASGQPLSNSASHYSRAYFLSYIVALIIPLLALGFKLVLIGPELEAYYSCWSQARAGNPDALNVLMSQGLDVDEL